MLSAVSAIANIWRLDGLFAHTFTWAVLCEARGRREVKREISFERIALIAGSLGRLATTSAFAQSTQTFNLSATMDVCNSCDIGTQNLLVAEDDRHDSADAALDCDVRSENVRHDQTDKEIEHNDNNSEDKQDQLADEEEQQQQSALESDQARARDRGGGASTADRPDHEPAGHR